MVKITDLQITKYRTSYKKDVYGNRQRIRTPYQAKRPVKVVEGGRRFAHYFIDSLIFGIFVMPFDFILSYLDYQPQTFGFAVFYSYFPSYILYGFYYFIFESLLQSSPGKMLTNSVVINEFGQKPTQKELIVRSVVRLIPFEILSCLSERGWHDEWSNTWVVTKEEYALIQEKLKEINLKLD